MGNRGKDNSNSNFARVRSKKMRARSTTEKGELHQQILLKARELFLTIGFENFSMRQLAKALNMSPGNLYNYFEDKRALWITIVNSYFDEFTTGIREVTKTAYTSFQQLFDKALEFYFLFALEDLQRFEMMFLIPPPSSKKQINEEKKVQLHESQELLEVLVKEAIKNKELPNGDSVHYAHFFSGLALGLVLEVFPMCKSSEDYPDVEKPEKFFEFARQVASRLFFAKKDLR